MNSLVGPAADYFHYLVKINHVTGYYDDFSTMKGVDFLMERLRDEYGNENRVSTAMNKISNLGQVDGKQH